MIRMLWFVIVTTTIVVGAVWIAERPGDVMLAWGDWRVGMRMSVLVLAILLFAIVVALAYRLWVALRRSPDALRHGWRQSRRERGYKALTQGMVAVSAGDGEEARRQATKADVLLNDPPLTMLLSAQAAQLNGDEAAARRYFTAMLERPETAFLGIRGLLMQARRDGNGAEALALADRAYTLRPKTPWVLSTKYELEARAGHWRTAIGTLEEAAKRGAFPPAELLRFRVTTLLGASLDAGRDGHDDEALNFARRACDADANALAATLRHAALLAKAGRKRRAVRIIEQGWARHPHPELARLYATLADNDNALLRVKQTEKLIAANPNDPESHFALAIAHLEAQLWGAARTHLDAASGDTPTARVCQAIARVEEQDVG
ncbi:MAG: heme biosynthesis HemY N-terminal domain-containing protein, partial [Alphaproteobacteria bacterium]